MPALFTPMRIEGPSVGAQDECERVLRSLPAWFGIESALLDYARDTTRLPTFLVWLGEELAGFVTLRQHFAWSWEIYCIAMRADARGKGHGRALLMHAEQWAAANGAQLLQVKTIAASHPSAAYAQTRAFYSRMGYLAVEVFPELWSAANPCLQMVKFVGHG